MPGMALIREPSASYKAAGIIDRRGRRPLLDRLGRRGAILRERGALAGLK